ncbi:BppU family phage baseplate upper protein [Bacillus pseudomycoides]|uniref:BppU family phage baseplate upper protein n=1 Tax=Bacillus pseudomycoides TaxID=64104 RepID=UPI00349EE500
MKTQTLTIDIADPNFMKVITSRINDKNGLKLTILLKNGGYPYDLSGYAIKYEAGNNLGSFIRDDCKIIDASNGVFEYTFSAAAVSTNVWVAYFAFEKGEERFTTQNIKVLLSVDVKQGKINLDNYISDFDKALEAVKGYRKEIDDTNKKIADLIALINANNVQVPKLTTDVGGALISISDATKNILDEIVARGLGINTIYCHGSVQGNTPNAKSWRGISFINSPTYGFIFAKDYQNKLWTNYIDDAKGWLGWVEHPSFEDVKKLFSLWGFDEKRLLLNGKSILEEETDALVISKDSKYKKVKVEADLLIHNKLQAPSNVAVWFHKEKRYNSGKWIVEFNDLPRWGFNRSVDRSGGLFHIKESGIYDIHAYLSALAQTADAEHILEIHILDASGKTIEEHEIAGEVSGYVSKWVRMTGSFCWYFTAGQKFKVVYNNKDKDQIYVWEARTTVTQLSKGLDENTPV